MGGGHRTCSMALALATAAFGCHVPDLDLSGRSCPCATGYTCDTALQVCVPAGANGDGGSPDAPLGADGSGDSPRPPGEGGVGDGSTIDGFVPDAGGSCPGGLTYCAGQCVGLDTDGHNCGACGRDCQGASCIASQCQPVLLTADAGQVVAIALDNDNVYWASQQGLVAKIPKAGGTQTAIDPSTDYHYDLKLDSTSLYWTRTVAGSFTGGVVTCPITGCAGAPTVLATTPTTPEGLTLAGGNIFWVDNGNLSAQFVGSVKVVPAAGGATTTIASSQQDPNAIASDGANVYWCDGGHIMATDGSIMSCPLAGCGAGPTTVVSGVAGPYALVLDTANVYFASYDMTLQTDSILSCPLSGCSTPTVLASIPTVGGIAVDATFVYWTEGALIERVPLGGGAASTLATYPQVNSSFSAIAQDGTTVYWGTSTQILKVTK